MFITHKIMRHCQRTPEKKELYSSSPYYNETSFAPYGYGQLTNEGKRNCYNIGTALRQRYQGFIDSAYHYSTVEGISSSYERTKESLQLVLAGLYPPTEELRWSTELNWLPIATSYEKKAVDLMMTPTVTDWYEHEFAKFEETDEAKILRKPFLELKEYISENANEEVDFKKMVLIVTGLKQMEESGMKLPKWTETIYPHATEKYLVDYLLSTFATKKLRRMMSGYLMRKIVESTEMRINGSSKKQIVLYSGHDVTLVSLLKGLDVWDKIYPAAGAYCTLELHYVNNVYGFKLYHFNRTLGEPYLIQIPGYGEFLPFEDLKIQKREYIHLEDLKGHSIAVRARINYFINIASLSIVFYSLI